MSRLRRVRHALHVRRGRCTRVRIAQPVRAGSSAAGYVVPDGCTRLGIVAWGAAAVAHRAAAASASGAAGGLASATIAVHAGQTLTIVVGAPGFDGQHGGGGGGGVTGVFDGAPSQTTALVIASAGGAAGGAGFGDGAGGGYAGAAVIATTGAPGTQTAGGIGTHGGRSAVATARVTPMAAAAVARGEPVQPGRVLLTCE